MLEPYQVEGARWLAERRRAILADKPGVGKTPQAIAAVSLVGARRALVVTKKSLLHQWRRETERFGREDVEWDFTTYESVARHLQRWVSWRPDVLVVDETRRICNPQAVRTKALFRLSRTVPYVWLLTGSLVHNRPTDVWPLLHVVDPSKYRSLHDWARENCTMWFDGFGWKPLGFKDPDRLREELRPFVLSRDKSVVGLPPKTRETIWVEPSERERQYLDDMRGHLAAEVDGGYDLAPNVVSAITRMRQACCDLRLVGVDARGSKTEAILETLEDLADTHKVLVFTTFVPYAELLVSELPPAVRGAVYHGGMTASERDDAARAFSEDPDLRVLACSVEAAGEGLNLQGADVVVFANRPLTQTSVEQAEDRAHRRGQEKSVHVLTFALAGTVEEKIESLLAYKRTTEETLAALVRASVDDSTIMC